MNPEKIKARREGGSSSQRTDLKSLGGGRGFRRKEE